MLEPPSLMILSTKASPAYIFKLNRAYHYKNSFYDFSDVSRISAIIFHQSCNSLPPAHTQKQFMYMKFFPVRFFQVPKALGWKCLSGIVKFEVWSRSLTLQQKGFSNFPLRGLRPCNFEMQCIVINNHKNRSSKPWI